MSLEARVRSKLFSGDTDIEKRLADTGRGRGRRGWEVWTE